MTSAARGADAPLPGYKEPLPLGDVPKGCDVVTANFWQSGIARHDRRRLSYAVWAVLSRRLFI